MRRLLQPAVTVAALFLVSVQSAAAQPDGTLVVHVRSRSGPVAQAEVRVGELLVLTDAKGEAALKLSLNTFELMVSRFGFQAAKRRITMSSSPMTQVSVDLEEEAVFTEDVVVTATRTGQRIQDLPLRVEVVPQEEIDEKLFMTPGDVSMMLTETNGLRVQVTSPSLGAASVRVQGLRGRYTQILADGLPLYGQTGSIGVLQIPPMDLGQVEVIKGVASALYGASALGGVINLVSRRPQAGRRERELLVNRTTRGGTDTVGWLSDKPGDRWGYTLLGGGHWQERADADHDGWADLPSYWRGLVRPRVVWEDGAGRSLFMTVGALAEDREGGTMPGAVAPDGVAFLEALSTRRFDGGLVGRFLAGGARVVTIRASGFGQWHGHQFGDVRERDFHHTLFAEASVNGTDRRHTWVLGAAIQRDLYRARDLPTFNYTYTVPGVFAQDDYAPVSWLTVSASGRLDRHNEFGTFFSPRVSALLKLGAGWTLRPSSGTGFFAPTPFTEETEATGLSRLAPIGRLEPERGRSFSLDLGWKRGPLELTATTFRSVIDDPIVLRERRSGADGKPVEIVNAPGPNRTVGSELIARFHRGEMDLIATHMFVWGTEQNPETGTRREVALNPRHSAGIDWLWDFEGRGRMGVEVFYTGRQQLNDSPFRQQGDPYLLWGLIGEWRIRRARVFMNSENLGNVRQTRYDPLVRPSRASDGRWTVDAWAPLEGRTFNAGLRFGF
ncbi:MAG: TonB-dependent receptor [Vicinamibacterales bacterium]